LAIIDKTGPMAHDIPDNAPIHGFKAGQVRYALPVLLRLCRSLKPDTDVSTLPHLNLGLIAGKVFFPSHTGLIVREANTPSLRLRHTSYPRLYRFLYRTLYPHADRIICNAVYVKKDLESTFAISPQKINVISNPVDVERISRAKLDGPKRYPAQGRHLVAVGRLNRQKGFDLLLKAFHHALQEVPDLQLTIVGDGPDESYLRGMANELGVSTAVTFEGYQENPYPFMAQADLLVSSSRWEGLPNVVLEALACGTPVVAFDCPGGTQEIIRNEENGWLVPTGDTDSLGDKIVELMAQKKYARRRDLLPATFFCDNVVRAYENLLMESSKLKAHSSKP
jgi:glycosyltransferase involved in cell wall biosynthesis